jgi:hypothetical protein
VSVEVSSLPPQQQHRWSGDWTSQHPQPSQVVVVSVHSGLPGLPSIAAAATTTIGWIIIVMISPIVTAVRIGWNFFMVEPDRSSTGQL